MAAESNWWSDAQVTSPGPVMEALVIAGLPTEISAGQYQLIYNVLSLVIAAQLFTALFLFVARNRVSPRFRVAVLVSATVCAIAAYHYFRIFNVFGEAYPPGETIESAHQLSDVVFNEGYRYVDWLLTVPLLLVETVAILALAQDETRRLLFKLIPASALMIALGYPGELTTDTGPRLLFGTLSTIPFAYILYVLFVELSASLDRQPENVRHTVKMLRLLLIGSWGVYPVAYLFPVLGFEGATAFTIKQVGYSLADIVAKAAFGLVIYSIARRRTLAEDPDFATEAREHGLDGADDDRRPVGAGAGTGSGRPDGGASSVAAGGPGRT